MNCSQYISEDIVIRFRTLYFNFCSRTASNNTWESQSGLNRHTNHIDSDFWCPKNLDQCDRFIYACIHSQVVKQAGNKSTHLLEENSCFSSSKRMKHIRTRYSLLRARLTKWYWYYPQSGGCSFSRRLYVGGYANQTKKQQAFLGRTVHASELPSKLHRQ